MKLQIKGPLDAFVVMAILAILVAMLLPALFHAPAKYGRIKSPPGVHSALRQVQLAYVTYSMREGMETASLNDLVGLTVLSSEGEKMPFTIEALEQELGTNATAIKCLPEFRPLDFGAVPTWEILLAYVPDPKNSKMCYVAFRDGKTQRLPLSEVQAKEDHLRSILRNTKKDNRP